MSTIKQFDHKQHNILTEYFNSSQQFPNDISYWEAVGFLFVVACSPELVQPSQWLPIVYNIDEEKTTMESAQETLGAFMALYNELNRQVQSSDVRLLPGCEFRKNPIENLEPDAPISQWASGFVHGYDWLEEVWGAYVPDEQDELDEELGLQMLVLSFFASPEFAQAFVEDSTLDDATVETMAADIQPLFEEAMSNFALLSYSIQQMLLTKTYTPEQPARSEKVGRNEPCPCGSGKKYKKCCGVVH